MPNSEALASSQLNSNGPDDKDASAQRAMIRPRVAGKFLLVEDEKFYVRGVTYGAFKPDRDGNEFQDFDQVERDFAQMAASGLNAVRIPHTTPPRKLLDIACRHGLRVMVGLSAEQYVGYLVDRQNAPDIGEIVREKVRSCAGHPALLCYGLGNELSASLVRWLGSERIEQYLRELYDVVKSEDPAGIVTYVNYPTTEYLHLPFLDLLSFNVYLESQDPLEAYLARLQNLAGDRPLLMSETGLDSLRNGEAAQAQMLDWQIRTSFAAGCAGTFLFAWTDEWHRDGEQVDDWKFGLTDQLRNPKPALAAVEAAFAEVPFPAATHWPPISVVVCSYNGNRTLPETLSALCRVDYPNFEVIVIDDGSQQPLSPLVDPYPFQLIRTDNCGLSHARNTGLHAASGEIIVYLDDDARPDSHWLQYLASMFQRTEHLAVGGPNVAPADETDVAHCVANAPGGPIHVLISDSVAEHVPGCNLAIRSDVLKNLGGFDPRFHAAGDDVDICWRLRQHGTIGFHAGAMVWHRRRNSVRGYWKQQCGYGSAEAMLQEKWPDQYNTTGHATWEGRIYCDGISHWQERLNRIYYGVWGNAPFQRVYHAATNGFSPLALPEWYLAVLLLVVLLSLSVLWTPLLIAAPLLAVALVAALIPAYVGARRAPFPRHIYSSARRVRLRFRMVLLHLIHPVARLWGRFKWQHAHGGNRTKAPLKVPLRQTLRLWRDVWKAPNDRLLCIDETLRHDHPNTLRGGEFDRWDIQVRTGLIGGAKMILAAEDHAGGHQMVRVRCWPTCAREIIGVILLLSVLAGCAAFQHAWTVSGALAAIAGLLSLKTFHECGTGLGAIVSAIRKTSGGEH